MAKYKMKSGPMLTTMILRWRVLTEPLQRFTMMRFWPGYLSRSRTTSSCSVSRFSENILDVSLICDLQKKVSLWTWSCLSELFFTNLKETTCWNIFLLRLILTFSEVPEGGGDTKMADTDATDFSSPGIDDMYEASEIKCKNLGRRKKSWVCWPHGNNNMLELSESEDPVEKTCQL